MKKLLIILGLTLLFQVNFSIKAEEKNSELGEKIQEFNFFTGVFDFSHDKKNSTIVGIQHQNEDLFRQSFLGTISPVSGFFVSADSAAYLYTGIQAQYNVGKLNLTPSFTPGLYHEGDGKDLGHMLEFKSELQVSYDLMSNTQMGLSYNHISNASLGKDNPGANSYMFNLLKKF